MLISEASEWFPQVIEVETVPLDAYRTEHRLAPPDLIKIDTQGSELRILQGAARTFEQATVLIVEAWLERAYGPGTPLLHELILLLAEKGYLVADTIGEYREGPRLVSVDLLLGRNTVSI